MSTRWYPLYQKGNPQLRVFLPNFWMKMIKSEEKLPANQVKFIVSMEMSKEDVKNYLEKIYKIPTLNVTTYVQQGEFKKAPRKQYVIKDDDYKVAFVTLDKEFTFPDIFPKEKADKEMDDEKKHMEQIKESYGKTQERHKHNPDIPQWFT